MTELEKLAEATIAPYLEGEFLSPEAATLAANALKAAMQDRGYSLEERATYLALFINNVLRDPTVLAFRDELIRAMCDGFGFDVSVTPSPDRMTASFRLTARPVQ